MVACEDGDKAIEERLIHGAATLGGRDIGTMEQLLPVTLGEPGEPHIGDGFLRIHRQKGGEMGSYGFLALLATPVDDEHCLILCIGEMAGGIGAEPEDGGATHAPMGEQQGA